jgi:phosphoribosyl 1,2-cyclic phosphate phosphodiesterase
MEMLFLGTGAGDFQALDDTTNESPHVVAARQAGGRNLRYAAACLVAPDILIDCHDTRQLKRFCGATDGIRHLLITHGHFDHFQPLAVLELAAGMSQPLQVYGTAVIGSALAFAAEHVWDAEQGRFGARTASPNLRFHSVDHGDCFAVDQTRVTSLRANHMLDKGRLLIEQPALNYVIERDGVTVYYGLDSSYLLPETMKLLAGFHLDAVVLDATFGDRAIDPAQSGHMNFAMVAETVAELRAAGAINDDSAIIASHISLASVPPHDAIEADLVSRGITLAYDGMVWDSGT